MSDAPELIWVTGDGTNGSWTLTESRMKAHMPEGWQVPYIRADLANPTRAQQLKQALAMPEIKALVKALRNSAQGWYQVVEMDLIKKKHYGSARALQDEAEAALAELKGEQP